MAFRIKKITRNTAEVHRLDDQSDGNSNRITLLVGPNGSGKTQVLVEMLTTYARRRRSRSTQESIISLQSIGEPSRVIAQTFSPFSRFPRENPTPPTLKKYLDTAPGPYAAIGLTRNNGIGRPIAREVAGRILRRLHSNPDDTSSLSVGLLSMGFAPRLRLVYVRSPLANSVNFDAEIQQLNGSIREYLELIQRKRRVAAQELPLLRELSDEELPENEAVDRLVEQLIEAISRVKSTRRDPSTDGRYEYVLDIDMKAAPRWADSSPLSKLPLDAFLVLGRMGFLRIGNCYLEPLGTPPHQRPFAAEIGSSFDITDASSGQQQTLSSLFGIAAEIENNALLLIDEPELSLHPAWQSSYLDNLQGILSSRQGCEVFIATHSPLIAQRARELGLQMIDLAPTDDANIVARATASVDQILLEDFKVPVRDSTYVAHLLLSLVMKAEREAERGGTVAPFLLRLRRLQSLYNTAPMRDGKIDKLIGNAIEIVSTATVRKPDGNQTNG